MGKRVDFLIKDKIAFLTLNRPEKRNAIDNWAVDELTEYFRQANSDQNVRAIVFGGKGPAFSSGADLNYILKLSQSSRAENLDDSMALKNLLLSIYVSKKLVCAVVRGPALASAFGLVLSCDIIFASEKAKFGFTEVRVGFVPALVLKMALRKMTEPNVRRLVLTGKMIDSAEALRIGLIWEIIDDNEIEMRAGNFLKEFVSGTSKNAVELTKEVLSQVKDLTLEDALKYGAMMNAKARSTEDFKKGIEAFVNKKHLEWE
jgi:methylglutaconyl-CoA hydratase